MFIFKMWNPDFPERHKTVWQNIFNPMNAAWNGELAVYPFKLEALQVLFINHNYFSSTGIMVMKEYSEWCDVSKNSYKLNDILKIRDYLNIRLEKARERCHKDNTPSASDKKTKRTSLIEECVVTSFRVAITHLDAVSKWQGYTSILPLVKQECIQVLYENLLAAQIKARAQVRDYAATSRFITKRLTVDDRTAIVDSWWSGEAAQIAAKSSLGQEWAQIRGLLMNNLQKSMGRRGADIRNIRLSMLFPHNLPNTRPVTSCPVIGASLRHVKECTENVEQLIGWARTKERYECPLGALALYLVYVNDIIGPNILSMIADDLRRGTTE